MKRLLFSTVIILLITSCGYRSLHWKWPVEEVDRKFLDSAACELKNVHDTAIVICPSTATVVKNLFMSKPSKVKGVFMFSSDCGGFYETFAKSKQGFDSISDFSYDIIFNDDFVRISEAKRIMKSVGISGKFYIADENYYGRFVDERVKFKKMIEEFGLTPYDIRINIQGELPGDTFDSFKEKYAYLTGTLFYLMDESGKTISLTYNLSPDDVKSILAKMN